MYLNGSLDSSTQKDNTRFSDGAILHIGKTHDGSIYYNGIIDDIRIYDRKLSELESDFLAITSSSEFAHCVIAPAS